MKIKRILIGLDLSDYDLNSVKQAAYLANHLEAVEEVLLLHNIRFDFLSEMPEFDTADYEKLTKRIRKRIIERYKHLFNFAEDNIKIHFKVTTNNSTVEAFLSHLKADDGTLLIMGHKQSDDGKGILPVKLLSLDKGEHPILFCHKNAALISGDMLVSTDLSPSNKVLFALAEQIAQQLEVGISSLHVCKIPMAYFPYIQKENKELENQLMAKARKQYRAYIQGAQIRVEEVEVKASHEIASTILEYYTQSKAKMLLISRLGKTNLQNNPIGGVARRLLSEAIPKAILVV